MFWTRLLSGVVLVLLALLTIITGGPLLLGTLALLAFTGQYEFYRVMKIEKSPLSIGGYMATAVFYLLLLADRTAWFLPVAVFLFLLLMSLYVFTFPRYSIQAVCEACVGVLYLPVLISFIYLLRNSADGAYLVWLIILSSWGNDTFAYCVGVLFGKHKMAPVLSPKKSIEGAVGGVVCAGLLGMAYGAIFQNQLPLMKGHAWLLCGMICMAGAGISILGDLAASAIKRNQGIKDFGNCIPGHGGVLDRFDSIVFVAPVIYYLAVLAGRVLA